MTLRARITAVTALVVLLVAIIMAIAGSFALDRADERGRDVAARGQEMLWRKLLAGHAQTMIANSTSLARSGEFTTALAGGSADGVAAVARPTFRRLRSSGRWPTRSPPSARSARPSAKSTKPDHLGGRGPVPPDRGIERGRGHLPQHPAQRLIREAILPPMETSMAVIVPYDTFLSMSMARDFRITADRLNRQRSSLTWLSLNIDQMRACIEETTGRLDAIKARLADTVRFCAACRDAMALEDIDQMVRARDALVDSLTEKRQWARAMTNKESRPL